MLLHCVSATSKEHSNTTGHRNETGSFEVSLHDGISFSLKWDLWLWWISEGPPIMTLTRDLPTRSWGNLTIPIGEDPFLLGNIPVETEKRYRQLNLIYWCALIQLAFYGFKCWLGRTNWIQIGVMESRDKKQVQPERQDLGLEFGLYWKEAMIMKSDLEAYRWIYSGEANGLGHKFGFAWVLTWILVRRYLETIC